MLRLALLRGQKATLFSPQLYRVVLKNAKRPFLTAVPGLHRQAKKN
jgi:hypothetical protein